MTTPAPVPLHRTGTLTPGHPPAGSRHTASAHRRRPSRTRTHRVRTRLRPRGLRPVPALPWSSAVRSLADGGAGICSAAQAANASPKAAYFIPIAAADTHLGNFAASSVRWACEFRSAAPVSVGTMQWLNHFSAPSKTNSCTELRSRHTHMPTGLSSTTSRCSTIESASTPDSATRLPQKSTPSTRSCRQRHRQSPQQRCPKSAGPLRSRSMTENACSSQSMGATAPFTPNGYLPYARPSSRRTSCRGITADLDSSMN